jgi:hypothetical protein
LADPVMPTEVFRFAAPCLNDDCKHFQRGACHLATKVARMLSPVSDQLPTCKVRAHCRWFLQEGRGACQRCPQIVTDNVFPTTAMRMTADPDFALE